MSHEEKPVDPRNLESELEKLEDVVRRIEALFQNDETSAMLRQSLAHELWPEVASAVDVAKLEEERAFIESMNGAVI